MYQCGIQVSLRHLDLLSYCRDLFMTAVLKTLYDSTSVSINLVFIHPHRKKMFFNRKLKLKLTVLPQAEVKGN